MGFNVDADEGEDRPAATPPLMRHVRLAAAAAVAAADGCVILTNGTLNGRGEGRHKEDVAMTAMLTASIGSRR